MAIAVRPPHLNKKIILVSRCAWTLYNFRSGLLIALKNGGATVLCGGAAGDGFEAKIEAIGLQFVPLPVAMKGINPLADVKLFYTLYRWYCRERPDVVHHFTIKPVIYGSLAARLAGVPRIVNTVTGLGFVFIEENLSWLRFLVSRMYRLSLASAHFTFFQNQEDLQYFLARRLVSSQRVGLLPGSGVDCRAFTPSPIKRRTGDQPLTFLLVARLLREKGVYEFVEAARLVKHDFPRAQFQLLGRRDERNPTVVPAADIDRWQKDGVITWLGEVADVRPIVAQADIVVLPSYREGTPRCLLEAAAMGKPIIATNAVGCREVVEDEHNGLLVPIKDAQALAQAMTRMIKNPEMREVMGKAGRQKVERKFDERVVIDKLSEIYNKETL